MHREEAILKELSRVREQKRKLERENKQMKQDIFAFIQEKGLFNPWWGKNEDAWLEEDYGFNEEADRGIEEEYLGKALFVQEALCAVPYVLKLLEIERLCKDPEKAEEIQETKQAKSKLEKFKANQIEYASAIAEERFAWKHPGYTEKKVLSMIQLKSCWREEADY